MAIKILTTVAATLALFTTVHAVAPLAPSPCPRHVQSVLLSRQYDDCLAHLGDRHTSGAWAFTETNARALRTSVACSRALAELLHVAPPTPCVAELPSESAGGETGETPRVLVETEQLQWIADHPASRPAATTRRLAGGSSLFHVRYDCHFENKHPFTADTDMTEDFTVLCRENLLVEYPSFWKWVGYIVLGLVGVMALLLVIGYWDSITDSISRCLRRTREGVAVQAGGAKYGSNTAASV